MSGVVRLQAALAQQAAQQNPRARDHLLGQLPYVQWRAQGRDGAQAARLALIAMFLAAEALGTWSAALDLVLIVLLPKPDGGLCPICLFPPFYPVVDEDQISHGTCMGGRKRYSFRVWRRCQGGSSGKLCCEEG